MSRISSCPAGGFSSAPTLPAPSACPGRRIPVLAWPRASPSRGARLPRSPFRSPKSPATFEEVYAGEALPPSPPVRGARGGVPPLEGVPRGLACLGSGCPGPAVAAASCLLRGLAPPALQEESSQQILKITSAHSISRKFLMGNV